MPLVPPLMTARERPSINSIPALCANGDGGRMPDSGHRTAVRPIGGERRGDRVDIHDQQTEDDLHDGEAWAMAAMA